MRRHWIAAASVLVVGCGLQLLGCSGGGRSSVPPPPVVPAPTPPSVTLVDPASSDSAARAVTITGGGFSGSTAVSFGAIPAVSFSVVSDARISAVIPAATPGGVDVSVTTPAGTSAATTASRFTYAAVPLVTGLSPARDLIVGGATIRLLGTDLGGATGVSFGGTPAQSYTVVSGTEISAVVPARPSGTVDVLVTTLSGTSVASSATKFVCQGPPTLASLAPSTGPSGGGDDGRDHRHRLHRRHVGDFAGNRVRVVCKTTGTYFGSSLTADRVYTLIGDGTAASTGDGGAPTSARLNGPLWVVFDAAGTLCVSEYHGNRVRAVARSNGTWFGVTTPADRVFSIAGDGSATSTGDGLAASAGTVSGPGGLGRSSEGNLFVSELNGNRVREIAR
ncbi:MAG: IPT/TIG domain-containing protein [Planctomycetota bacterium]